MHGDLAIAFELRQNMDRSFESTCSLGEGMTACFKRSG
jgi:hypothetical protein